MSVRLVMLLALAAPAGAADLGADLSACRTLADNTQRLGCYDRLAAAIPTVAFSGQGSGLTPAFDAGAGQTLRFENTDVIFVAYLLDATGQVVQNLHQGGAGTGAFVIAAAGNYRLQINASGGWRVWLDPR